ncbi:ankyrin repeat domain-containing protein [Spiroplasma endosymbiont of Nebria brevicollis]|uniref:ankyrin repeat domain-containing protein n=1 Tax=Spiroplasma endosymbiont of Nebria brevicollis TaxID=3066284 RepID=UPI00313C1DE0
MNENERRDISLLTAAKKGRLDVVEELIVAGADVNHKDEYGYTPLMFVARNGHLEIDRMLLGKGADVNHKDEYVETALILAERNGHTEIKEALDKFLEIKGWIETNKEVEDSFEDISAIEELEQETRIIELLEAFQTKIEAESKELNLNVVNFLKKEFINNLEFDEGSSILHIAVRKNMPNLFNYLVENQQVDINAKDKAVLTAWKHACLLLQKENVFTLKKPEEVTDEEREFLKENLGLFSTLNKNDPNVITYKSLFKIFVIKGNET